jgi:hypothetical protein
VITRYADVQTVLSDPRTYSSRKPTLRGTGGVRVSSIDTDLPAHRDFRQILNPFFHPRYLARYEAEIRRLAATRIEGFAAAGSCEFLGDFASRFVADVLATVIFNEATRSCSGRSTTSCPRIRTPPRSSVSPSSSAGLSTGGQRRGCRRTTSSPRSSPARWKAAR